MFESKVVQHGQVLAAMGLLVGLALAAPLLGILMFPVAAVSALARARSAG